MPLITTEQSSQKTGLVVQAPTQVNEPVKAVSITPDLYAGTFVDLTWKPRVNLLTHVEGSAWSVTYYSQILTKDSALSGVQLSASPVYQTYTQIQQLVMRVTNPLSSSQDDQTKAMKVAGSAILPPCVIPNEGDMFIADIGEGKTAVLRVTQTEKKSIYNESCYEISYEIDTDTEDKRNQLNAKSAVTYHYYSDYLTAGRNPLITTATFDAIKKLSRHYSTALNQYHRQYYSSEYSVYLVGGQDTLVYDHYLSRHMLRTFDQTECPGIVKVTELSTGNDEALRAPTLWDAVVQQDELLLNYAFKHTQLVSSAYYKADVAARPLAYSGVDYFVYPSDYVKTVDPGFDKLAATQTYVPTMPTITLPWTGNNASVGSTLRGVNLSMLANQTAPIIYPVTQDTAYVLSEHFYNQDSQRSVLEQLTLSHIRAQAIDLQQLYELVQLSTSWSQLERYYYVPLLLTIIKAQLAY